MNRQIRLTVNGKKKEIRIDVRQSLLEVLREQLGLLSVKQGCSVGECGACTVLIDDVPIDACPGWTMRESKQKPVNDSAKAGPCSRAPGSAARR